MHPREEMSTSALIDKMFEDVLQAADRQEKEELERGNDSGVSESRAEADLETSETEPTLKSLNSSLGRDEECDEEQKECEIEEKEVAGKREDNAGCNEEDFLFLPPSCVLSPLSKSVEAVVTPMVSKFIALVDVLS